MTDLQLLTGICILVTGFVSLKCGMSAYHWRMVVYLAWFSSLAHLSGLVAVRSLVRSPWEIYLRLGVSMVFLTMLMVATIPVSFFDWADPMIGWRNGTSTVSPGSPAACYFDLTFAPKVHNKLWNDWCKEATCIYDQESWWTAPETPNLEYNLYYKIPETPTFQATVFSLILLAMGFAIRLIKFMPFPSRIVNILSRQKSVRILQRFVAHLPWSASYSKPFENHRELCKSVFGFQPLLAGLVVCHIHLDLVFSMIGEVSFRTWLSALPC